MKFQAFTEGIKPDKGADDKYNDGVRDEEPVENNETDGDVVPLNDRPDGHEAGNQECNAHDESGSEVAAAKSHVQKQVVPPPYERENDGYNAEDRNHQREETIEPVQVLRRHSFLASSKLVGTRDLREIKIQ